MPGFGSDLFDRFFGGGNNQGPFGGDNDAGEFVFMFEEMERMMSDMERLSSLHGFETDNNSGWKDIGQVRNSGWLHSPSHGNVGQGRSLREQFLRQSPPTDAPRERSEPAGVTTLTGTPVQDWRASNSGGQKDQCFDCDSRPRRNGGPFGTLFGSSFWDFSTPRKDKESEVLGGSPGFFNFSMQTSRSHTSDGVMSTETVTRGSDGREVITRTTVRDGQRRTVTEERHPDGTVTRTEQSDPTNVRFDRGALPDIRTIRPELMDTVDQKRKDVPFTSEQKHSSVPFAGRFWKDVFSDSQPADTQRPWWKFW